MIMKHNILKFIFATVILFSIGCKKYLDYQPQGALSASSLSSPEAVNGLATAAYAGIANDWWDAPITSMWEYGSVRSDDAYKGGGDIGDHLQTFIAGEYRNRRQRDGDLDQCYRLRPAMMHMH